MKREVVLQQLQALKMNAAAAELDDVTKQFQGITPQWHWLSALLEREVDERKERAFRNRVRRAQFPRITSLEHFNWEFNPDIDKEKVLELASLRFLEDKEIALFLGKPGTGKTHLALAIALKAVQEGLKVHCTSVKKLAFEITLAKAKGTLDRLFRKILSAQLWILDDWGVVSMRAEVSEEVFDLLDRRIGSNALILTSNRDVDEWPQVFHEPVIASAAIDRLFDNAHIVAFTGKSYRLNSKIEMKELT